MSLPQRYLAPGPMPEGALPEDWLAAGPWCFVNQEEAFPDWENRFLFAPEPPHDDAAIRYASSLAQTLALSAIPIVAAKLDENWQKHQSVYWQITLLPWTMAMAIQITQQSLRAAELISAYGDIPLNVDILPYRGDLFFVNESDFAYRATLNPLFMQWLLTRILEERWPKVWRKSVTQDVSVFQKISETTEKPLSLREKARKCVSRLLLELPFPRLKGMSVSQALRYSAALVHPARTPDNSLDLNKTFCKPELLQNSPIPECWPELMLSCIPQSIKNLRHDIAVKKTARPRLRVASTQAYEDSGYRQKLALWKERGHRLGWVQHGSNYGQIRVTADVPLIEYSQDLFFTWGWDAYSNFRGTFKPMPYPQLQNLPGRWKQGENLLVIGTAMNATPYKIDTRHTPLQVINYRNLKADFFANLPEKILSSTLYRSYIRAIGCLDDADWVLPRVPGLRECKGPLLPHMLSCRLLVFDHPGTTMLEAFAADIPLVAYWNREHWRLGEECDKLLDELERCGIWHDSPEKAAKKVEEIWEDAESWIRKPEVANARRLWRDWQAMIAEKNPDSCWIGQLKKL